MALPRIIKRTAAAFAFVLLLLIAAFAIGVLWPDSELAPVRTTTPVAIVGATAICCCWTPTRLEEIRNTQRINTVVFNGNVYDGAALDRISAHVERRARRWTVACKILWHFIKNPVGY